MLAVVVVCLIVAGSIFYISFHEKETQKEMKRADALVDEAAKNTANDNFALAYKQLVQAQSYYNKNKDEKGKATVNTFLALMHYAIGQPNEFLQYLKAVQPHADLLDTKTKTMFYRINAIALTENYKNYKAALASIGKAITEDRKLEDKRFLYQDQGNMAQIYLDNKNYKLCNETLNKIAIAPSKPYYSQVLYCRMRLAFAQNNLAVAKIYADSCLANSRQNHQTHLQVEAMRMIKDLDKKRGDDKAYIDHYEQFIRLNDTLTGASTTYRIAKMKDYFQIRIDSVNAEKKDQIITIIIWFLLILILALGTIFFLLLRRTQEKKRIAELEAKNLDAEVQRGTLERELLQLKMEKNSKELEKSHQDNVKMSLQLASLDKEDKEKKLELFDSHFELLDSDFKKKVEMQFPMMTKAEMRLLCLIKLGISNPEVLSIFNISSAGLYKLRYRLRKRLQLQKGEDLERYIENMDV